LLVLASPRELEGQGKVKDTVVSILGKDWPLSLKEIYFAAIREYGMAVSYQAVHKATKQLAESKIIIKRERRYSLNIGWIKQVKGFSESLEKAYNQPAKKDLPCRIIDLEKEAKTGNQLFG